MTTRFILLVGIITFLALITVWQEVQSVRFGYNISELIKVQNALTRDNINLTIQLARLKSPDSLMNQAKTMQVALGYPSVNDKSIAATAVATTNKKPQIKNRYSKTQKTR
jgi:hypothetical protein